MKNSKLNFCSAPAIVGYTVLWCRALFRKIKFNLVIRYYSYRNKEANHVFWYSKKQYKILTDTYPSNPFVQGRPLFKGNKYSEMREIGKGICNWDDAVIVGVGGVEDVTMTNPMFLK